MQYELYVDTARLDDHVYRIRDEERLVERIQEHIRQAGNLSVDVDTWRYYRLRESAEQLERYFIRMASAMGNICEEYNALGRELSVLFDEAAEISNL